MIARAEKSRSESRGNPIYIHSLKVGGIFRFASKQKMNFADLNVFIGENGSGKTNIFRCLALSDLLDRTEGVELVIPHKLSPDVIHKVAAGVGFDHPPIDFRISLSDGSTVSVDREPLEFRLGDPSTKGLGICGSTSHYIEQLSLINRETGRTALSILKDSLATGENTESFGLEDKLQLLNFGLWMIFGLPIKYSLEGEFDSVGSGKQGNFANSKYADDFHLDVNGGGIGNGQYMASSGVEHCAQFLASMIVGVKKSVWLLDEPELHLEPRLIRRLLEFVLWLNTPKELIPVDQYPSLAENLCTHFDRNTPPVCANWEHRSRQIFVATHSPVVLNFANSEGGGTKMFGTSNEFELIHDNDPDGEFDGSSYALSCYVQELQSEYFSVLDELGVQGSDILQCNGVVWVEGPSDVIYLLKWLEMYAKEESLRPLWRGSDYEFQMYGGALLSRICLYRDGDSEGLEKLVSMFSFSRNAFVVIDSDAKKQEDGSVVDIATYRASKLYIKKQIENMPDSQRVALWFEVGNTNVTTIEDYLDPESRKMFRKSNKAQSARNIVNFWGGEKRLEVFPNDLKNRISELYGAISSWQK